MVRPMFGLSDCGLRGSLIFIYDVLLAPISTPGHGELGEYEYGQEEVA